MENITPDQVMTTIIVISTILAALFTLDKFIDLIKKWRQPALNIQEKLAADKVRLEAHDKQILNLTNVVNALCKAQIVHLTHELTGNDIDKLKEALTLLTNTTIDKIS